MKKILFPLVCIVCLLTSCLEEPGYEYSTTFSRIVTIDRESNPIRLKADLTNEVFKPNNLASEADLDMLRLGDAKRMYATMRMDVKDYKQTLTYVDGQKIDIVPVTNKTITDSLKPLTALQVLYMEGNISYPLAWVSEGYLNVAPTITSSGWGTYYLIPEKVKSDTLYFNLKATYASEGTLQRRDDKLQCFDLRTLRDTATADEAMLVKMREVLAAMEAHRNDSMRIVLAGEFATKSNGNDTIVKSAVITNYFKSYFLDDEL